MPCLLDQGYRLDLFKYLSTGLFYYICPSPTCSLHAASEDGAFVVARFAGGKSARLQAGAARLQREDSSRLTEGSARRGLRRTECRVRRGACGGGAKRSRGERGGQGERERREEAGAAPRSQLPARATTRSVSAIDRVNEIWKYVRTLIGLPTRVVHGALCSIDSLQSIPWFGHKETNGINFLFLVGNVFITTCIFQGSFRRIVVPRRDQNPGKVVYPVHG